MDPLTAGTDAVVGRFKIPLVVPFAGVALREGLVVEGPAGHGEVSPFPVLTGRPEQTPHYLAAMEAAEGNWPDPLRDDIPVHATIPAIPALNAFELTKAFGCASAKVKVGDPEDDERLAAVRDALGPSGRISIDANGAWDVEMAVREIHRFARHDIELVEQPVASFEEMREVHGRVDVPLAADESVVEALGWEGWMRLSIGRGGAELLEPLIRAARSGACDALVLKVQRLGGVRNALRAVEATGLPGIASSIIETSIGLAAGVALAAALPELPFSCGLATQPFLEGDLTNEPLLPESGVIHVRRPSLDPELLKRYEVTDA
jgi:o-succinylbenzoate synthase